ncbi:hypothetical protein L7F22_044444 [Adiantum nelumboides]|nr:hypothetical protein [Adiantum nelumboides]
MDKGQEAIHFAETVCAQNAPLNQVSDNIATQGQGSGVVIQENCLLRRLSDDSHYFQTDPNSDDANIMPVSEESRHGDHIKKKLPGLVRLTLPPTPELPTNSAMNDSWKDEDSPHNDSDDSLETEADRLPTVKPFPVYTRMKTRLQDPPPITPVVKSQLTYCKSTLTRQKTSIQNTEQQIPTADTGPVCFGTLEGLDPAASSQTSANLGQVSSSSKMKPSASGEEEKDLLVDEDYIAEKKYEENKGLIITQWCSLLVLITLLVCTNKIRQLEKVIFLGLNLWRWQALTLVIFCGHLISGWIMKLLVSLIEKHYLLKKKVLYFVYGLRHSVKSCIWLALVLGVWEVIFQGHEDTLAVNIMTRILWCFFTASVAWMLKVLAVKIAANSFHRKAYFDRIQDCLFNQYVLERLSGPPCGHIAEELDTDRATINKRKHKTAAQSVKVQNEPDSKALLRSQSKSVHSEIPLSDQTSGFDYSWQQPTRSKFIAIWHKGRKKLNSLRTQHDLHGKTSSTGQLNEARAPDNLSEEAPHHKFINIGLMTPKANISMQVPDQNTSAVSIPTSSRTSDTVRQEKLQGLTSETVSVWTLKRLMRTIRSTNLKAYSSILSHEKGDATINSEVQARIAAKQVFNNMAKHGQRRITLQNFIYFLPEEHLARAFAMFETTENGEVTKESFIKWVVNVYTERRALCLTLNDNKTVVEKLHRLLNVVLVMILIPVFVLIFGVETPKILVFFTSLVLPSVFMFGNSAKNVFESLIFLFVTHPFDVGDRIVVDGQTMLVEVLQFIKNLSIEGVKLSHDSKHFNFFLNRK